MSTDIKYTAHHTHESKIEGVASFLAYFDIFNYPLTAADLLQLTAYDQKDIQNILQLLEKASICYSFQNYFTLNESSEELVKQRLSSQENAKIYWEKSKRYIQKIANFPFVRAVAISGSLSKGVMQPDGDIDYFIITSPKRLWLTRSLLILYKKVRLFNSRKYFCVNYFVDTKNLEVIDKNLFTAIEVAHLVPVFQEDELFDKFFISNQWVMNYFPVPLPIQKEQAKHEYIEEIMSHRNKSKIERWLSGKIGNRLELWAHKITLRRWMHKFGHFDQSKFELTMRSTEGVSKHHPQDFQSKVLLAHQERLSQLLIKYTRFQKAATKS